MRPPPVALRIAVTMSAELDERIRPRVICAVTFLDQIAGRNGTKGRKSWESGTRRRSAETTSFPGAVVGYC